MDILFVNPNRIQPPVAPLACDYLGEALHKQNHRCIVADLGQQGSVTHDIPSAFWKKFQSRDLKAVMLTFRNLDDAYYFSRISFLPQTRSLVHTIREALDKPLIIGGAGYAIAPEALLSYFDADFGISGAAEKDLTGLLDAKNANYNYNENRVLVEALEKGHRGAFWDILRRMQEDLPPLELPPV